MYWDYVPKMVIATHVCVLLLTVGGVCLLELPD